MARETAQNVKTNWAANLIYSSVFEKDIGCIMQIANRVDGTVPIDKERDLFANLVGDALEDVLDYGIEEKAIIYPSDPTIIAIAKTIIFISQEPVGKNPTKKKERQKAVEMILSRVGGKKSEPVREAVKLEYVEPDWMAPLPSGDAE